MKKYTLLLVLSACGRETTPSDVQLAGAGLNPEEIGPQTQGYGGLIEYDWIDFAGAQIPLAIAGLASYSPVGPDINASGEVVYRAGSCVASMITSTVKGALGNGDHASINDSGEIVWTGINASGMPVGIFSSVHGLIAAGGNYASINNAGQVVYTRYNGTINELFVWDNGVSTLVAPGLNAQAFPVISDSGDIAFMSFGYNSTAGIATYSLYLASYGASVPEPAGIALLGLAMLAAGAVVRRRR